MNKLKKITLSLSLIFFTACGTETDINPSLGFDMWEYMTSARSYEVGYDIYENGLKTDYYNEVHRQLGEEYRRESAGGITQILLGSSTLLMNEPNSSTTVIRFLHLGDSGVFQSNSIQNCRLDRFYDTYQNKGPLHYNVIQVNCNFHSGVYQEFYYGYNEGIVTIYEDDNGVITEYVKVSEREIF